MHARLVGWFLVHAWRVIDLLEETADAVRRWQMTVAPVLGRALLEAVGCLLCESRLVAKAWAVMKVQREPDEPGVVRSALSDQLYYLQFDTRLPKYKHHEKFQATNVYTYVDKLAKVEGAAQARSWYDELSDAAHPALGLEKP